MKKDRKRGRKKVEVDLMAYENPLNTLAEKNRSKLKKYTSFVYDNQTYSVGDDVMILNKEDYLLSYLCRIRELVLLESSPGRFLPMLKVQWYPHCLISGTTPSTTSARSSTASLNTCQRENCSLPTTKSISASS